MINDRFRGFSGKNDNLNGKALNEVKCTPIKTI